MNKFNLTGHQHRSDRGLKEDVSIPFDAPDVITPTKFTNSQNSLRRRTMTGVDMINSQPSTRELKRPNDDIKELLESSRHKEPRLNYSTGIARDNMFSSQPVYNQHNRNDYSRNDNKITQAELLEKNYALQSRLDTMMARYKELSDTRLTEAEEISYKFKINEGYREEAYSEMERAIQELQVLKSSGGEGQKQLVERLQAENQNLKEQLKEQSKVQEKTTINSNTAPNHLVLFEALTGLKVTGIKKAMDGELYLCTISGPVATHKFTLFIPKESNKPVEYTPTNENNQSLASILPDFLLEEIDFAKDNLPVFFWRLSSSIHSKS